MKKLTLSPGHIPKDYKDLHANIDFYFPRGERRLHAYAIAAMTWNLAIKETYESENQVQKDVRKALDVLNCSQKQLAKLMSVSPGQVSKWLRHGEYMSLRKLQRLNDLVAVESAYAEDY
jgi:DNA-binding transcriptional regulator YiaG